VSENDIYFADLLMIKLARKHLSRLVKSNHAETLRFVADQSRLVLKFKILHMLRRALPRGSFVNLPDHFLLGLFELFVSKLHI
jgi:hypothetical protein